MRRNGRDAPIVVVRAVTKMEPRQIDPFETFMPAPLAGRVA